MYTPQIICESVFMSEAEIKFSPKSSNKVIIETYLQEAEELRSLGPRCYGPTAHGAHCKSLWRYRRPV